MKKGRAIFVLRYWVNYLSCFNHLFMSTEKKKSRELVNSQKYFPLPLSETSKKKERKKEITHRCKAFIKYSLCLACFSSEFFVKTPESGAALFGNHFSIRFSVHFPLCSFCSSACSFHVRVLF